MTTDGNTEPLLGGSVAMVAVDGGSIEVEVNGHGPAILLVHGWTLDRRIWEPQIEALAATHRVVAYDRRGFGRSTAPADLARESADIVAIADSLSIDRFALVGMSQGGRVALHFALTHPARVAALVLQGAPLSDMHDDDPAEAPPVAEMRRLAAANDFAGLRAVWRDHPLTRVSNDRAAGILSRILGDYAARDLAEPGGELRVTSDDLAQLRCPLLVITGEDEPDWRHRVAQRLAEAAPGPVRRITLSGAGHLGNLCRPDAYNRVVLDFLETALVDG